MPEAMKPGPETYSFQRKTFQKEARKMERLKGCSRKLMVLLALLVLTVGLALPADVLDKICYRNFLAFAGEAPKPL